jgi:hypothetical protein
LELITQAFAIAITPVVNAVHSLANGFLKLNDYVGGYLPLIMTATTGLLAFAIGGSGVSKVVSKMTGLLGGPGKGITGAIGNMAQAVKGAGKEIALLGVALLAAGVGIGAAAAGISLLATSMKGMGAEAIALVAVTGILVAGMYFMIGAMVALAPVAAALGPILIPLGIALLLIGGAIGLAAVGISFLVDSFGALFKTLIEGASSLPLVAGGLMLIAAAVTALSFAGLGIVTIGAAMAVLTAGVVSLAAALGLVNTEELLAVSEIAKSLNGITIDKSVAFQASMEGLENAVVAMATVPPATMANVTEFVKRITEVTATAGRGGGSQGAPGSLASPNSSIHSQVLPKQQES